jgi:hypothetical protein
VHPAQKRKREFRSINIKDRVFDLPIHFPLVERFVLAAPRMDGLEVPLQMGPGSEFVAADLALDGLPRGCV